MKRNENTLPSLLLFLFYLQIAHIQTYILRKRKVSNEKIFKSNSSFSV
jgi:hypothetical protein